MSLEGLRSYFSDSIQNSRAFRHIVRIATAVGLGSALIGSPDVALGNNQLETGADIPYTGQMYNPDITPSYTIPPEGQSPEPQEDPLATTILTPADVPPGGFRQDGMTVVIDPAAIKDFDTVSAEFEALTGEAPVDPNAINIQGADGNTYQFLLWKDSSGQQYWRRGDPLNEGQGRWERLDNVLTADGQTIRWVYYYGPQDDPERYMAIIADRPFNPETNQPIAGLPGRLWPVWPSNQFDLAASSDPPTPQPTEAPSDAQQLFATPVFMDEMVSYRPPREEVVPVPEYNHGWAWQFSEFTSVTEAQEAAIDAFIQRHTALIEGTPGMVVNYPRSTSGIHLQFNGQYGVNMVIRASLNVGGLRKNKWEAIDPNGHRIFFTTTGISGGVGDPNEQSIYSQFYNLTNSPNAFVNLSLWTHFTELNYPDIRSYNLTNNSPHQDLFDALERAVERQAVGQDAEFPANLLPVTMVMDIVSVHR